MLSRCVAQTRVSRVNAESMSIWNRRTRAGHGLMYMQTLQETIVYVIKSLSSCTGACILPHAMNTPSSVSTDPWFAQPNWHQRLYSHHPTHDINGSKNWSCPKDHACESVRETLGSQLLEVSRPICLYAQQPHKARTEHCQKPAPNRKLEALVDEGLSIAASDTVASCTRSGMPYAGQ